MRRRSFLPISIGVILLLVTACSTSSTVPTAADAWARPGLAGGTSAVYLTITNPGTSDDALVSATSTDATAEVHESSTDASGMMSMAKVEEILIPGGGAVTLEPGGFHVMLMGLQHDLKVGETIEVGLVFRDGGTVMVQALVREG